MMDIILPNIDADTAACVIRRSSPAISRLQLELCVWLVQLGDCSCLRLRLTQAANRTADDNLKYRD